MHVHVNRDIRCLLFSCYKTVLHKSWHNIINYVFDIFILLTCWTKDRNLGQILFDRNNVFPKWLSQQIFLCAQSKSSPYFSSSLNLKYPTYFSSTGLRWYLLWFSISTSWQSATVLVIICHRGFLCGMSAQVRDPQVVFYYWVNYYFQYFLLVSDLPLHFL